MHAHKVHITKGLAVQFSIHLWSLLRLIAAHKWALLGLRLGSYPGTSYSSSYLTSKVWVLKQGHLFSRKLEEPKFIASSSSLFYSEITWAFSEVTALPYE